MTMPNDDTPTLEFRAHLEWEIARAIRREARFGAGRRPAGSRRWRTVGLVTICLAAGMAVNFASAQVRTSERRDSLLAAAQADLQILVLRLNLARQEFTLAERQAQAGVVGADGLATAQAAVNAAEAQVARAQFGIDEIRRTALPPRDELTAPRVDGQDYVAERLQVDLLQAQRGLQAAEVAQAEVDRRVRVGVDSQLALMAAHVAAARAQADLAVVAKRLALRRQFLTRGTPADSLASELHGEQVRQDLMVAQQQLALAQDRLVATLRDRTAGTAAALAAARAQLEVRERMLEVDRLVQQLRQRLQWRFPSDSTAKP